MHSLQAMMDGMNAAMRQTRGQYQMTLGRLITEFDLRGHDHLPVLFEDGTSPDPAGIRSYRGYYSDLSISTRMEPTACGELLAALQAALGQTFTAYKGGDYTMGADTPLWVSAYGEASGIAIMDARADPERVFLITRQVD